jgi:hypothetical protein
MRKKSRKSVRVAAAAVVNAVAVATIATNA